MIFLKLLISYLFCSYPDVMMPSYWRSQWAVVYFAVYISVILYFLMNLVNLRAFYLRPLNNFRRGHEIALTTTARQKKLN